MDDGGMDALERKRLDRRAYLVAAAVLAIAGIALFASVRLGPASAPGSEWGAVTQCERFVDSRLKAPATADYNLSATEGDGSWTVIGVVDSENGFGAKVRNDVRCVLRFDGGKAHLDDIAIG